MSIMCGFYDKPDMKFKGTYCNVCKPGYTVVEGYPSYKLEANKCEC